MSDKEPTAYLFGPEGGVNLALAGDLAFNEGGKTTYPVVGITVLQPDEEGTDMENVVFFNFDEVLQLVGMLSNALAEATHFANAYNEEHKDQ